MPRKEKTTVPEVITPVQKLVKTTAVTVYGQQMDAAISMCNMFTEIENTDDYEEGIIVLKGTMSLIKAIEEFYKPFKEAAHNTHKLITTEESSCVKPLKAASDNLKQTLTAYMRRQQEEENRIVREAQAQAQAKAEQERKDRLKELNAAGKNNEATELAATVAAAIVPDENHTEVVVPSIGGISYKRTWVVNTIIPDELPRQYLIPDEKAIATVVAALGPNHNIPGVTIKEKDIMLVRT